MGLSVFNPVFHKNCSDGFPLEFFTQLGFFPLKIACVLVFTKVSGSEI